MTPAEHTFAAGMTRAGKTTLMEALLKKSKRCIAFTTKKEDFDGKGWIQVYTPLEALQAMQANWPRFKICVRALFPPSDPSAPCRMIETFLRYLWELWPRFAGKNRHQLTLCVDEIQRFYPRNSPIKMHYFDWLITEGCSAGINLLCGTQHPTTIPTIARSNFRNWYILALSGAASVEYLKKFLGSDMKRVRQYRYAYYCDGDFRGEGSTKTPKIDRALP